MLSGSTALITTIFKCPSMKPCGAALTDAVPASIRKMQAAAMHLGTDDIRTKDQADSFHYPGRFSTVKRAAHGGPLCTIKGQQRLRPAQRQLPHALRVRRCVDQVWAVQRPHAGWDACRWLD